MLWEVFDTFKDPHNLELFGMRSCGCSAGHLHDIALDILHIATAVFMLHLEQD